MNPTLKIVTIQTFLHWEDVTKNIQHFDSKINQITEPTDIIVLPEMFTTGFTMNPKLFAEEHEGQGLQWMIKKAKEKQAAIVGSISVKEKEHYYNRLYWVNPDGTYQSYDKRHLFTLAKEDEFYTAGTKKIIVDYKGWKICPLVCYDLRFPIWSRNREQNRYDVLIYVANWPEVRSYPWKQLLIARAIENQCFVVGANRIGNDGNGFNHTGDTVVLNPRGEKINNTQANEDKIEQTEIAYNELTDFRKIFPVLLDADDFTI